MDLQNRSFYAAEHILRHSFFFGCRYVWNRVLS